MKKILYILLLSIGLAYGQNPAFLHSTKDTSPVVPNTLKPTISGFYVDDGNTSRIYFDSSENLTVGINGKVGFIINGWTISSVTIQGGQTSGHFFTVSVPLRFWDNILIRYEGGSDIEDVDNNGLYNFQVRYIENRIDEPTATTNTYYVDVATGNDSDNGSTEALAWATIDKAMSTAQAGSTVWIKAGNYGNVLSTVDFDGTAINPIKFIGYDNNPVEGDSPELNRRTLYDAGATNTNGFDSGVMPLVLGGGATIVCRKNYIIFRNLQIHNTTYLSTGGSHCFDLENSSYVVLDNCYSSGAEHGMRQWDDDNGSGFILLKRCYAENSGTSNIRLANTGNLVIDTWSVSTIDDVIYPGQGRNVDYYINFYGGDTYGYNNTAINSYIERVQYDGKGGPHGFSFKGGGVNGFMRYSLVQDGTVVSVRGGLEFRHAETQYCVFRNVTVNDDNNAENTGNGGGLKIVDGASFNLAEGNYFTNLDYGIKFRAENATEQPDGNKIYNNIFNSMGAAVTLNQDPAPVEWGIIPKNSIIANNTFYDCNSFSVIDAGWDIDNTNNFTNNIVSEVGNRDADDNMVTDYNDSHNGPTLSGTGNITVNPNFVDFVDFVPQATTLNIGLIITDLDYDFYSVERSKSVVATEKLTVGAVEIDK